MAPIQPFGRFFRCERPGIFEGGEFPVGCSKGPEMASSVDRESDFGEKFDFIVYRRYDEYVEGSLEGKSDGYVGNSQPCRSHLFESDKQWYVSRFNDLRDELTKLRGQLAERDKGARKYKINKNVTA